MKFKFSKSQWEEIGKKAGWMKKAQSKDSQPQDVKTEDIEEIDAEELQEEIEANQYNVNARIPSSLNRDQKSILDPAAMALKNQFKDIQPDLRDPKGRVVIYNMFDALTDGNKTEITKNLGTLKPILNKFKSKEDSVREHNENQV